MDKSLSPDTSEFEIQTDILTLLENVKCQGDNPSVLKQALQALATICSSSSKSQEYFYSAGGVEELKTLLTEGSCPLLAVPAALYCLACAVRQHVNSQNAVLTEAVLTVIHELLSHEDSSDELLQAAVFLLACAVSESGRGQLLVNETGCMQDLVHLFRECLNNGCDDENTWSVITRAIGVCVNNPQNDHNQQICSSVLPHILKMISRDPMHKCLSHAFSLIAMIVANNEPNQARIRRCSGIETLALFIKKHQSRPLGVVISAVTALDACIADNEDSAEFAGRLGLVPVLLDLLQEKGLETDQVQILILTLAHVMESCNEYCQQVSRGSGCHILINLLTDCQDEELCKVIKYIFTLCKTTGNDKKWSSKDGDTENYELSARDLTYSLSEDIATLSNQLSLLEKLPETIQWMKKADVRARNLSNSESSVDSCSDLNKPETAGSGTCTWGEFSNRAGGLDITRQKVQGRLTHAGCQLSYLDEDEVRKRCAVAPTSVHNNQPTGQKNKQVAQGSFAVRDRQRLGTSDVTISVGNRQYLRSECADSVSGRNIPADICGPCTLCHSEQPGVQSGLMNISCGSSVKFRNDGDIADWKEAHGTASGNGGTAELGFQHSLNKALCQCNNLQDKMVSACDGELVNSRKVNSHQCCCCNRKTRAAEAGSSEVPDLRILGEQESRQLEAENAGCKEISSEKNLIPHRQIKCQKSTGLCCSEQESRETKHMMLHCVHCCHRLETEDLGAVDDTQYPESVLSHKSHTSIERRRRSHTLSPDHAIGNVPEKQTDGRIHISHSTSNTPPSGDKRTNLQNCSTHLSNPGLACVHTECQSNSANGPVMAGSIKTGEEANITDQVSYGNRLQQVVHLQKVMSSLISSLIPSQDEHPPQKLESSSNVEQQSLHIDSSAGSTGECNNILSACDVRELQPDLGHTEVLNTECISHRQDPVVTAPNVKQVEKNQACDLHTGKLTQNQSDGENIEDQAKHTAQVTQRNLSIQRTHAFVSSENKFNHAEITVHDKAVTSEVGSSHEIFTSSDYNGEHKVFVKPLQPPSSTSYITAFPRSDHHSSNIRRAKTPAPGHMLEGDICQNKTSLAASKLREKVKKSGQCLPEPSPALSQFDSLLDKMASNSLSVHATNIQPLDESSSGFESLNISEHNGNSASVTERGKDLTVNMISRSDRPQQTYPPISDCQRGGSHTVIPLQRKNAKCQKVETPSLLSPNKHLQAQKTVRKAESQYRLIRPFQTRELETKEDPGGHSSDCSKHLCPGCAKGQNVNSRTYNICIETSAHACHYHRSVRQLEREYIHKVTSKRKLSGQGLRKRKLIDEVRCRRISKQDEYSFTSDTEEVLTSPSDETLPCGHLKTSIRQVATQNQEGKRKVRRQRVLYSKQELLNLLEGVATMGKCWQQILFTYHFHPSRSAVDLKDKYKTLKRQQEQASQKQQTMLPLSMCEVRRLKRGVREVGYNWKAILKNYRFLPGRTAADLHRQWRTLNQEVGGKFSHIINQFSV